MAEPTLETYVVRDERLTIARLIWRRFRRPMPGMAERVLTMNPGLAAMRPFLAVGTSVRIPIDPPTAKGPERPVVQLWD